MNKYAKTPDNDISERLVAFRIVRRGLKSLTIYVEPHVIYFDRADLRVHHIDLRRRLLSD